MKALFLILAVLIVACDQKQEDPATLSSLQKNLSSTIVTVNNIKGQQATLQTQYTALLQNYQDITKLFTRLDTSVIGKAEAFEIKAQQYRILNNMTELVSSMMGLHEMITITQASLNAIQAEILVMQGQIETFKPDTIYNFVGDGNIMYQETEGKDTVNIIVNDSVTFKIWKTGSQIIKN